MKLTKEGKIRNIVQFISILIVYIVASIMEHTLNIRTWGYSDTLFFLIVCLITCCIVNMFVELKYNYYGNDTWIKLRK